MEKNKIPSIKWEDMEAVQKIGKKYGMSLTEFAKAVASQSNPIRDIFIRYSKGEIREIERRAAAQGLTSFRYTELCCKMFIENTDFDNFDTSIFRDYPYHGNENRNIRRTVRILNRKTLKGLEKIAHDYSVGLSTVIRYCVMNVDVNKTAERR